MISYDWMPIRTLSPQLARTVFAIIGGLLLIGWVYFSYMAWTADSSATGVHAAHSHGGLWSPPHGSDAVWTAFDFLMLFVMWVMMMLAMMLPAVVPFVALYANISATKRMQGGVAAPTFVFVLGYLIAWAVYSVFATILQYYLHVEQLITPAMESDSYLLSGVILLIAGIYQWTPLKEACLKHCQMPMGYLVPRWRDGYVAALRLGAGHGLFCVGCCWALMLIMLAVGMMNMLWLLVLTLFIFFEKTLIPIDIGRTITGVIMIIWGGYWFALGV